MADPALYDEIGIGYADYRVPDPRIRAALERRLAGLDSLVNLGAGAGSYEPCGAGLVAVEPSLEMIRQRPADAAPALQAISEHLPLGDRSVAGACALLTLHHWGDWRAGLREARRVAAERVVLLTWFGFGAGERFWLLDYFPEIETVDAQIFPTPAELRSELGEFETDVVPIPHDCTDGFLAAYWARPERYLEPGRRRAISSFASIRDVEAGVARLAADLESGAWDAVHGALRAGGERDFGYRLVVANLRP